MDPNSVEPYIHELKVLLELIERRNTRIQIIRMGMREDHDQNWALLLLGYLVALFER